MFSEVPTAQADWQNLRSLLCSPPGTWRNVVYVDSAIEIFADLCGRDVFLGPPSGAESRTNAAITEAVTGLVAGEDGNLMRIDWISAEQVLADRQMDVYSVPSNVTPLHPRACRFYVEAGCDALECRRPPELQ
ncbi:MAG: hypothetical protein H6898_02525 [Rhodobacter sp.]|nr:hypothetical protein [Paracoccaceae bacterium]MCC0075446.1 hypothetical protein [Rhodobacter sp.]